MKKDTTIEKIRTIGQQVLPTGSSLWLYGSRARGDFRSDSDWDLLVLLDKEQLRGDDYDAITYPLTELGWDIGEVIRPVLYTKKEWEAGAFTPFYHNVQQDKKVLI